MNQATLQGRVGNDPETRQVGETTVTTLRLATSRKYKDKQGQLQEETQWHTLDFWGKLSDNVSRNVKKGCKILVQGEIQNRQHEEKLYTSIRVGRLLDIQWPKNADPGDESPQSNDDNFLPF